MREITRVIYLTNNRLTCGKSTGRIDFVIRIMSYFYLCIINILVFLIFFRFHINHNFINCNFTDFLVSMTSALCHNLNDSTLFQFFNMTGQCTICNSKTCCKFIHVHFMVFLKKFDNINSQF